MIDNIFIPSSVHVVLGILVMLGTLTATIVTAILAFRRQGITPTGHWVMVLAQIPLILQALIGVKLLDQGSAHCNFTFTTSAVSACCFSSCSTTGSIRNSLPDKAGSRLP